MVFKNLCIFVILDESSLSIGRVIITILSCRNLLFCLHNVDMVTRTGVLAELKREKSILARSAWRHIFPSSILVHFSCARSCKKMSAIHEMYSKATILHAHDIDSISCVGMETFVLMVIFDSISLTAIKVIHCTSWNIYTPESWVTYT